MKRVIAIATCATLQTTFGCMGAKSYLDQNLPAPAKQTATFSPAPLRPTKQKEDGVVQAAAELPVEVPRPSTADQFVQFAVMRNPRIARAAISIDAAQGRYVQAGLYPNPEFAVIWDEIGDRTGAGGVLTAPQITQSIVTGRKLQLSQAVAAREVDQTTLDLLSERYSVVGSVRASFYQALAITERAEILNELVKLADEAVSSGKTLLENKRIARLDLLQLEVQREQLQAEARAVARELPAAYTRLAATAGDSNLPVDSVTGSLNGLPAYDLEQTRAVVLVSHPNVRSAKVNVERAQAAIRRAQAEPIPNVTLYGGFVRQYENRSYDGMAGISMPVPLWDRNQGNIRAAQAELGMAVQNVAQVENELALRVAVLFQTYSAARERAEQYQREILPRAEETYKLSLEAFKGGQFEYLRVIQAQRAIAEAKLELNKSQGDAWRAAAELSGMLLEEVWPVPLPVAEEMR